MYLVLSERNKTNCLIQKMAITKTCKEHDVFGELWNTPSNILEKNVGRLVEIECGMPKTEYHRISVYKLMGTQFAHCKDIMYRGIEVSTTYFNECKHYGYRSNGEEVLLNTYEPGVSYPCNDTFGKPINPISILNWVS